MSMFKIANSNDTSEWWNSALTWDNLWNFLTIVTGAAVGYGVAFYAHQRQKTLEKRNIISELESLGAVVIEYGDIFVNAERYYSGTDATASLTALSQTRSSSYGQHYVIRSTCYRLRHYMPAKHWPLVDSVEDRTSELNSLMLKCESAIAREIESNPPQRYFEAESVKNEMSAIRVQLAAVNSSLTKLCSIVGMEHRAPRVLRTETD